MCEIVVVDDSPTMLQVVSTMLRDYTVETFSTFDEAAIYLQSHKPQMLLLDLHLKDHIAFEIFGALDRRTTEVVLMTGSSLTEAESKCRVLHKPFSKAELRLEVASALKRVEKKKRPH